MSKNNKEVTPAVVADSPQNPQDKKGRPTPTRAEREAQNRRPLIVDKKAHKDQVKASRAKAQEGMARGEERFLLPRDKGEQRRFIRDWVDARFSIGEVLIPVMIVVILVMSIPNETIVYYAMISMWAFVLAAIVDALIMGRQLTKRLSVKFGADKIQKGTKWYAAMRAVQMRILRLPKPQTKYGQWPS
ncbi:MAG: DUF3043 domain-containing protein [Microbacteriaceae bacterium]